MPFTKKVNDCINAILKNFEKLNNSNISVVFAIHHKGEVHAFGNKHAKEFVKNNPIIKKELEKDALGLCNNDENIREPEENAEGIEKLPAPLKLLKAKEAITILRNLVCFDHNKSIGGTNKKKKTVRNIRYGDETWEPKFWPNQIWKWKNIKNFAHMTVADMKEEGLGDVYEHLTDFFRDVLKAAYEYYGLDSETYISEKFTKEQEKYRKRVRNIKSPPRIVNPAPEHPRPRLSELFNEEPDYVYRSPAHIGDLSDDIEEQPEPEDLPEPDDVEEQPEPEPILSAQFMNNPESAAVAVPHCVLRNVWPNTQTNIQKNKKGGSSLTRAAAQALGYAENDFWKIRMQINEIIIHEFESYFHDHYTFPGQHATESGNISFSNSQDFKRFLRTPASMSYYNNHVVELVALASLIGASVHVLHQVDGNGDGVLNLDERWRWSSHAPISTEAVKKNSKFYTSKDMYFITEDKQHFYLLTTSLTHDTPAPAPQVSSSPARPALPEGQTTPEPAVTGLQTDSMDANIIDEVQEELDLERFGMVPIGTLRKAPAGNIGLPSTSPPVVPGEQMLNIPSSEEDFAEDLNQTHQLSNNDDEYNNFNPLGTSSPQRKSKKGKKRKAHVSELRRSNRLKSKNNTLKRLLEIPDDAEKKKEEYYKNVEKQRKERLRLSAIEESEHEEFMENHRRMINAQEQEADELIFLADDLRTNMTNEVIDKLLDENKKYFDDVKCGLIENWRHKLFNSPCTAENDEQLRFSMVGSPFTEAQLDYVWLKVQQIWELDPIMNSETSRYVSYVMLPTIYIRLYQVYMGLDTFEEAERRVRNPRVGNHYESSYNGEL